LLMGRVTYEQMATYWPNQPGGTPMVDYINSVPKYVVSTTLEEPLEWKNSTLIKENFAEEIIELTRQPGKDITILGSGVLVQSAASRRPPRRAQAYGSSRCPGRWEAALRRRE
jgi:dihydrofolate reductase